MSNSVVNILFLYEGKASLVLTEYLEQSANHQIVNRLISKAVLQYGHSWELVDGFSTDNVSYAIKAVRLLKESSVEHALHLRCLAHGMHLVATRIINDPYVMITVGKFDIVVNQMFCQSSQKQRAYKNYTGHSIPYHGIITRWNTWYESIKSLSTQFYDLQNWIKTQPIQENLDVYQMLRDDDALWIKNTNQLKAPKRAYNKLN